MFKNLCSDQQSELLPEKTITSRSDRYRGEIDPHTFRGHTLQGAEGLAISVV